MTLDSQIVTDSAEMAGPEDRSAIIRERLISSSDLLDKEFDDPNYIVPGIISEGLTILAGAPKVGKSWLILSLASDVSLGNKVLGAIDVPQARTLYLSLEDSNRRLFERLVALDATPSDKFEMAITWPRGEEGLADLQHYLQTNPETKLVVIDTLARFWQKESNQNTYQSEYELTGQIKQLADEAEVGIVLLHHTRKMGSDDFVDKVSGTSAIAGSADTTLVLERPRNNENGLLYVTGRDIEEQELSVSFDLPSGWTLSGDGAVKLSSPEREDVYNLLLVFQN